MSPAIQVSGGGGGAFQPQLYFRNPRFYPFSSVLGAGLVSGGATVTLNVPDVRLNTGLSAGVQLCAETVEHTNVTFAYRTAAGASAFWSFSMIASVTIYGLLAFAGSSAEESGLEIGSPLALTVPALPVVPIIRLFADGTGNWNLLTARGDGTAASTVGLTVSNAMNWANDAHRLMIVYTPGVSVSAYVDGELGATQNNATVPNAASPDGVGAGIYARCNAGAQQVQAGFGQLWAETMGKA